MKQRVLSGLLMAPLLVVIYLGNYVLMGACFLVSFIALREFYNAFKKGNYSGSETTGSAENKAIEGESFEADAAAGKGKSDAEAGKGKSDAAAGNGKSDAEAGKGGASLKGQYRPVQWIGYLSIVLLYFIAVFLDTSFIMIWVTLVVILCFLSVFSIRKHRLEDGLITLAGVLYVVFFFFHIVLAGFGNSWVDSLGNPIALFSDSWFRNWQMGLKNPVWLVILSAFGTDIFAYFTGRLIGRRKLAPGLSPNKTIEGSVGGVIGSTLLCGFFGYYFLPEMFIHTLVIGVLGSGFAQLGDLTASLVKRRLNIKDYGNLIPGHGGVLDRFDSLLFTAPLVFYYINTVGYILQITGQSGYQG